MIKQIIDGICIAINHVFGDSYEIYTESVEQGFQEPCFSILCLNPTINQKLGKRQFRINQFCIHYFPKSTNDARNECIEVAERLIDTLEYINVDDDLTRGNGMHYEIIDGVLSFFINYDLFMTIKTDDDNAMDEVIHGTKVKG